VPHEILFDQNQFYANMIYNIKEHFMLQEIYHYPVVIKETYLDFYGHVNNATYLTLFEEARWEFITQKGYGVQKIRDTGLGPVVLEVHMRYLKELRLRDHIVIETYVASYEKKIGKLVQTMKRNEEVCCTAEFTISLFDLNARKLVNPTPEWLKVLNP
jgi:YbgC/YbaW family acyl-CoA thioester hydrolase